MNLPFFINQHRSTAMWTIERTRVMKKSTPRNFSHAGCDETVSQRKNPVHSLRKYQKSILDTHIIFWNQSRSCLMRVAESAAVA